MGPIYTLTDFIDMIRRRIGVISFVVIFGCMASVYWAMTTPHQYTSSEVIQIEQPKIDNELAPTTVASSSARRLQLIEQQIMARGSLLEIIEKFGLYADLEQLRPQEKVDLLRKSVMTTGQAAARDGFADDGTISVLTITATMDSAETAQAVAHELADLTRQLATEQRRVQTEETLAFFTKREAALVASIAELEDELTTFRRDNDLTVEGSVEFRRDELAGLNEAILDLDREIIATQLARDRIDDNERAITVQREIQKLEGSLESMKTQRGLLVDRREILRQSLQTSPEVDRRLAAFQRRMTQLQGQLALMTSRRSEAEVGFTLESGARGERLTTIEEAPLPDYPVSMSRKKRAMIGGFASVIAGLALAFALELRHPVLRTARQMERETGLRPVVSIPDIQHDPSRPRGLLTRLWNARLEAGQRGRARRQARMRALNKT